MRPEFQKPLLFAGLNSVRSCYSYGEDRNWNKLADMTTKRVASASVPMPGGVWVTGGYDGSNVLKSTEMVFLNKTTKLGTIHILRNHL